MYSVEANVYLESHQGRKQAMRKEVPNVGMYIQ